MSATCQTCGGTGWVNAGWLGTPPDPSERERGCPDCNGRGEIADDSWNDEWDADDLPRPPVGYEDRE